MAIEHAPHLHLAWGGTLFGTEVWQMGLNLNPPLALTEGERESFCWTHIADCVTDIKTWWGYSDCGASKAAVLQWVKLNNIGTDGKYTSNLTCSANVTPQVTPPGYTGANGWAPPQESLVLSLTTENRSGRGAFGRVFLPCDPLPLTGATNPTISAAAATAIGDRWRGLINALNNWPGLDPPYSPEVSIHSTSTEAPRPVRAAMLTKVTGIRVGNLVDTTRTRRNRLKESYYARTLA